VVAVATATTQPSPAKRRRRATTTAAAPLHPCRPTVAASATPPSAAADGQPTLAGLTVVPYRGGNSGGDSTTTTTAADLPFHLWHTDPALMAGCEPCHGPYATTTTATPNPRKLRVAVLLSGGVDSSVALRLAQAAGHTVEAFYLQIWFEEDFRNTWDSCPWEEDLRYAREVAAGGGGGEAGGGGAKDAAPPPPVPLTVVPLTRDYWRRVVRESVAEIRRGRTPNPDVLCNSRVKFGAFCSYIERERPGEFDRVASGHYARLLRASAADEDEEVVWGSNGGDKGADSAGLARGGQQQEDDAASAAATAASAWARRAGAAPGEPVLALTPDAVKDQTYFLAALSRPQVARAMFPIAALPKARVRALAASAALPTCARPDSQGICFLGKVRFPEFVREHLGAWPGPLVAVEDDEEEEVVEEERGGGGGANSRSVGAGSSSGNTTTTARPPRRVVVGAHEGYWFYTVGQRAGIRLPGGPWYVSRKDPRLNVVEVSRARPAAAAAVAAEAEGAGAALLPSCHPSSSFFCGPINWLSGARPLMPSGGEECEIPQLLVKVRHGPNTHAVAAFEVVEAAAGAVCSGSGGNGGGNHEAAGAHSPTFSAEERALAETELAALAAAEAAAAADEQEEGGGAGAPRERAAAAATAADGNPRRPLFARVRLAGRDQGLAAGQYAVFYQGGVCLGSAKMLAAR
jgi:tRNA-specific 2-thiouridylase